MVPTARLGRPRALVIALLAVLGLGAGCQPDYSGLHLRIGTGLSEGVYYQLGKPLADAWAGQLGMPRPTVAQSNGSVQNIQDLRAGKVDVAFCAADAAADAINDGNRELRALARIYDDYFQIVLPAGSPVQRLADLRGRRVSLGSAGSGVAVIAGRLLAAAGLHPDRDLVDQKLDLNKSIAALRAGTIDAFFWSGGVPTQGITALARSIPLRLLDLSDVLPTLQHDYPVYATALVPAGSYGMAEPAVTTLVVPNYLLVAATMPDDVAEALTGGLFQAAGQLVRANQSALSIDVHTAIYTEPVELHPGALAYYRSAKI